MTNVIAMLGVRRKLQLKLRHVSPITTEPSAIHSWEELLETIIHPHSVQRKPQDHSHAQTLPDLINRVNCSATLFNQKVK